MKTECVCETDLGGWLRKYDELERRLESVRRILIKYPKYIPPFSRASLPFERVEILLNDIQELHALMDTPRAREGQGDDIAEGV